MACKNPKIEKKCLYCKKIKLIQKNSKYCSHECYSKHLKILLIGEKSHFWKGGNVIKHCLFCQKEFQVKRSRENIAKYCSCECCYESKKGKPAHNKSQLKACCEWCKKEFDICPSKIKFGGGKYCSIQCKILGSIGKPNNRKKTTIIKKCLFCKEKFECYPYRKFCSRDCMYKWRKKNWPRGEKHWGWKGGKRKKDNERNDSLYQWWVEKIKRRDNNICQLKDENCSGYNIVHHIKSWRDYPELRYNINNGITLCQAHHPRKWAEEKRLTPIFQGLVSVSNALI